MTNFLRYTIFFIFSLSASIWAQQFEVTTHGDEVSGSLGDELIYEIEVENTSQEEITLDIIRTKNDIPDQWSSSLCFEFCFAPFIDTVSTTAVYGSSPLQPGEKRTFSVHVFPLEVNATGEIDILVENVNNTSYNHSVSFTASTGLTSVDDFNAPAEFELNQNYPNPFNPSTVISFSLPEKDNVTLKVYDIIGNEISTLLNSSMNAGSHSHKFDASSLPSGIYFYELMTSKFRSVKKMILEK